MKKKNSIRESCHLDTLESPDLPLEMRASAWHLITKPKSPEGSVCSPPTETNQHNHSPAGTGGSLSLGGKPGGCLGSISKRPVLEDCVKGLRCFILN